MYTNNVLNTIGDIPNGTTKRTNCPNCGGRNTFTVMDLQEQRNTQKIL